ncbi:MAG: hypothetical protein M3680_25465 [Myxococcota bacterium]|nr:hypothetical protein [Myxococcota bacterium]
MTNMLMRSGVLAIGLLLAVLGACDKKSGGGAAATSKYPGTAEGAKQMLTDIRSGDAAAMTRALKPTSADYKAVFGDAVAAKVETSYDSLWKDPKAVISADPANTELLISQATTEELQSWTGAADSFPGGYKDAAASLKPGLTFYRWKYVKPGETLGMAYDGLVHVNGHWAWFPKPWRALK